MAGSDTSVFETSTSAFGDESSFDAGSTGGSVDAGDVSMVLRTANAALAAELAELRIASGEVSGVAGVGTTEHGSESLSGLGVGSDGAYNTLSDMYNTLVEPHPDTIYYRASSRARPSLRDAMEGRRAPDIEAAADLDDDEEDDKNKKKFGMFEGVFARCLLNIWGVLMFLRLGWMVGHGGVGLACVIVISCMIVTIITTLSLSAICTNGEVKSGGAYFMISRSLGPEFGGAIGLLFSLANAGAVALHLIGFAETVVVSVFPGGYEWTEGGKWDQTLVALCALVFLVILAVIGVSWVIKFQLSLLVLLCLSIVSYLVGTFIPQEDLGHGGYSAGTLEDNFGPSWGSETFFTLFAVFFPASTGIMAGANISGDLKNPSRAIPRGTLSAVFVSGVVYLILIWTLGFTISKNVYVTNAEGEQVSSGGLLHNNEIMIKGALVPELIIAGVFAAGLSSALAALVGAPRVLQAVCQDGLFPFLDFFKKGRGPNNEPIRAYVLTFLVAGAFMSLRTLDSIAPLITNFFMISYAFINYACFATSHSRVPGWRPSFRFYNPWVALTGTFMCVVLMFLINWIAALVTFVVAGILYKFVEYQESDVNWGSARQAKVYLDALRQTARLEITKQHVKTYRPAFLVLTEDPAVNMDLIRFTYQCSKISNGVLNVGKVILGGFASHVHDYNAARTTSLLRDADISGFIDVVISPDMNTGYRLLMQTAGVGKLRPNTVVTPFLHGWRGLSEEETDGWVGFVRDALRLDYSMCITPFLPQVAQGTRHTGRIDVYWMVDDGGLPLLIAWLLMQNPEWKKCSLRVITGGLNEDDEQRSVSVMLPKLRRMLDRFRVPYDETEVIDVSVEPTSTLPWTDAGFPREELRRSRTRRVLRQREKLLEMSRDADLIIMTLPLPTVGVPAETYLGWLEMNRIHSAVGEEKPLMFVRGAHSDCLTYYS